MEKKHWLYLLKVVMLFAIYYISARFGLMFFHPVSGFATLVWPPTGISIAILIISGSELWPGIALGAFFANLATGAAPLVAIGIMIGNTLEALIGAYLFQILGFKKSLSSPRDILGLLISGVLVGAVVSASIGVVSLLLGGMITKSVFSSTWLAWWVGDALSVLVLAPFLLVWFSDHHLHLDDSSLKLEFWAMFSLAVVINSAIFSRYLEGGSLQFISLTYLSFLPFIWAALRFGQRGVTLVALITSTLAVIGTIHGGGPFAVNSITNSLLSLQTFMFATALSAMVLGSVIDERKHIAEGLSKSKVSLERILGAIGEGVIITDNRGKIIMVNDSFEDLLGFTREEVVGQSMHEVISNEYANGRPVPFEERVLAKVLIGEKISSDILFTPYYFVRKNKTRFPVSIVVTPIVNQGVIIGAVEIFRDVSKEHQTAADTKDFFSVASHHLMAPLAGIQSAVKSLTSGEVSNPGTTHHVAYLGRDSKHLVQLADLFINASRIDFGMKIVPKEFNVANLIRKDIRSLKPRITEKNLHISAKSLPDFKIKGDANIFRLIIDSVISVVIENIPKGKEILIEIVRKEKSFILKIKDTGTSFPASNHGNIMRYSAVVRNGKPENTSILVIDMAREAARLLGGNMWFESRETKGTIFCIKFLFKPQPRRRLIRTDFVQR